MTISDQTLAAARQVGRWLSARAPEHQTDDAIADQVAFACELHESDDPETVRRIGIWHGREVATVRNGEGALVGEAIERFGKQLGDAINERIAQGVERVEKTEEDRLLDAARKDIASKANVVGVLDGSAPGEFLVLTFQESDDGDQAMTLETWTATGPTGEKPGEFMVVFRPAHLDALSYTMIEARKLLEREGKVAAPGTEH